MYKKWKKAEKQIIKALEKKGFNMRLYGKNSPKISPLFGDKY